MATNSEGLGYSRFPTTRTRSQQPGNRLESGTKNAVWAGDHSRTAGVRIPDPWRLSDTNPLVDERVDEQAHAETPLGKQPYSMKQEGADRAKRQIGSTSLKTSHLDAFVAKRL
jgi:hypothetical protein